MFLFRLFKLWGKTENIQKYLLREARVGTTQMEVLRSPQFTLIFSVHGSISRTGEFLLEVLGVAERSNDSEPTGGVRVREDLT